MPVARRRAHGTIPPADPKLTALDHCAVWCGTCGRSYGPADDRDLPDCAKCIEWWAENAYVIEDDPRIAHFHKAARNQQLDRLEASIEQFTVRRERDWFDTFRDWAVPSLVVMLAMGLMFGLMWLGGV